MRGYRDKQVLRKHLSNIPGWRTKRKIIVFESDDWGAVRMASGEAYKNLFQNGYKPLKNPESRYLQNDSLASEQDLSALFEVLSSSNDKNNNPLVFTAVCVVANPNFEKIRNANYEHYFYEPFTDTLNSYPNHSKSFDLWKEGISNNLFVPQFHGREHLNVTSWMKALYAGNKDTLMAFDQGVYGLTPRNPLSRISYQAAFNLEDISELEYQKTVIEEGLNLFEELFSYRAAFFVPPNGPFNNLLEKILLDSGIKYIGASKKQLEPLGGGKYKRRIHYLGQRNKNNQLYLTRNCFFEPGIIGTDWVDRCLSDIDIAFKWRKPAVISSHRVNYIGAINPANRDNGLRQLKILIDSIMRKWPEVEFLTSSELGKAVSSWQ